jgi:hypothetical protein
MPFQQNERAKAQNKKGQEKKCNGTKAIDRP